MVGGTNKSRTGFGGVYPMLYAFFDEREGLDRAAMRRQVDALIGAGVHSIAVLGLATETNKLNLIARRTLLDWVAEDVADRLPLSVTVAEPSVSGQREFVSAAAAAGASWVILQPPPVRGVGEADLVRFVSAVAEASPVPVGLQVAPEHLGIDLSASGLAALARDCPNLQVLKFELSPLAVAKVVAATNDAFDIFNGNAGREVTDNLRAGCVGIIPGCEAADMLSRVYDLLQTEDEADEAEADRLYGGIAPLLTFLMSSLDTLLVYGKQLAARRLGLDPEHARPRAPYAPATRFGLDTLDRHSRQLGML